MLKGENALMERKNLKDFRVKLKTEVCVESIYYSQVYNADNHVLVKWPFIILRSQCLLLHKNHLRPAVQYGSWLRSIVTLFASGTKKNKKMKFILFIHYFHLSVMKCPLPRYDITEPTMGLFCSILRTCHISHVCARVRDLRSNFYHLFPIVCHGEKRELKEFNRSFSSLNCYNLAKR